LFCHGLQDVSQQCVLSEISNYFIAQWASFRLANPLLDTLLAVVVHAWDCSHGLLHLLEADGTPKAVLNSSVGADGWGALLVLKDGNLWLLMGTRGHRLIRCNQRDLEFKVSLVFFVSILLFLICCFLFVLSL
jgi:hypothetical protein